MYIPFCPPLDRLPDTMRLLTTNLAATAALSALCASGAAILNGRDDSPKPQSSVTIGKYTYENYGLVAFGRIANTDTDKYGESLGGLGVSALRSVTADV